MHLIHLAVSSVTTNRLRVSMLNTTQSTGILEWRVIGTPVANCFRDHDHTADTNQWRIMDPDRFCNSECRRDGEVWSDTTTGGSWSWTGPNSYTATTREITITNVQSTNAGTVCSALHKFVRHANDTELHLHGERRFCGTLHTWPTYSPNIIYNFTR